MVLAYFTSVGVNKMIRYVCICCYQLYQVDKLKNYNIIMSLGCHKVFQIWMFLYVGSLLFVLISIAMVTNAYCIFRSQCHCCINIHSHICWCCNTWIKSSAWLSFVLFLESSLHVFLSGVETAMFHCCFSLVQKVTGHSFRCLAPAESFILSQTRQHRLLAYPN